MNRPRFSPSPALPQPGLRALSGWRARLARDPIPRLLREGSPAVVARVRRDLIDDSEAPTVREIWDFAEVKTFVKKFDKDGSYPAKAPEKTLGTAEFAAALATLRAIDRLADLGVRADAEDGGDTLLHRAVQFLLATQVDDGSIASLAIGENAATRSNTVALHFQGWAMAALCRAGFDRDPRVDTGFKYLLERRQDDGGWAWRGVRTDSAARPSSHLVTGMVLRAFAASPTRRQSREARRAAELLATRFLQPDRYPDRKAPSYWEILAEPRFYTDVLDALDAVTAIGLGKENSGVRTAEAYIRSRQSDDGLWYPGPPPGKEAASGSAGTGKKKETVAAKDKDAAIWLTLRVLFVLRRIN